MAVHEEFLELCAVSVTGELTDDERKRLDEHLSACPSCRNAFHQYQETTVSVIPGLASEMPLPAASADSSWSEDRAEAALLRRLKTGEQADSRQPSVSINGEGNRATGFVPSAPRWGQFGMLYAAAILLFVSLAICAYRIGERRGVETASVSGPARKSDAGTLKSDLSDAGHERQVLLSEIAARDGAIAELKQQIAKQVGDRAAGAGNSAQEKSGASKSVAVLDSQNSKSPIAGVPELQRQSEIQQKESAEQFAHASALEMKVAELAKQLQDRDDEVSHQTAVVREREELLQQRDKTITQQEELLAHDRDIRDLMSARDLYIAEVYDVAKTGETNKPYGRIFYTKGKSLLFYAYDLDQQAGLKNASTFQAWGRRGTGHEQPVNLGILYEDSVANKRWVVKSEDSRTLEQIDAVFVTVEPHGGSARPSSKPLLFAYLRIHPNHP
jgi:Anti-sigma-K factor rskA, C-terminal/Putative zinc-finger